VYKRQAVNNTSSFKQAMGFGKFCLYQGTMPTDPDDTIVGTLLVTCTASSGALTAGIAPRWTGVGNADGTGIFTLNGEKIHEDVAATGATATTLAAVATAINLYPGPLKAWSSSTTLTIEGPLNWLPVATTNAYALAETGTMTMTSLNTAAAATAGSRAGVAAVNNCALGTSADGILSTVGTWSGVAAATGTANFFVWYGNPTDDTGAADASPWHCRRIIGTCGTSGSDYVMASTTITATKTHTVDTSSITMSESA